MAHNNQTGLTKPLPNTSTLQTTSSSVDRQRWNAALMSSQWQALQQTGKFEESKALSSMLALPENLHRVLPATIEQAMSDTYPTLATVKKYHGPEAAKDAVIEIMGQASALMNVGKNLKPHQIDFIAIEILQEFYWLNVGEIRYVMTCGVRGEYGEVYDRLDTIVIFGWIEKYLEVRTEIAANRARRVEAEMIAAEKARKPNASEIPMPEAVRQSLEKLENTFLVGGELKQGFTTGEFEPDAPMLRMIEMEWADLPEQSRPPYENYKVMRIAQLKALMKK